jgi:hypothetical protein
MILIYIVLKRFSQSKKDYSALVFDGVTHGFKIGANLSKISG